MPFGALKGDARRMIPRQYLLRRDVFLDPRNMQKDDIVNQLDLIYDRQQQFGPEDAFRFSHYLHCPSAGPGPLSDTAVKTAIK